DTKYEGVNAHLKRALELLSDKKNPDYRNSIKESISAVESITKIITEKPSSTLGDALKVLEKNGKIHTALKKGFSALYGFTSDEGGVRHAMLEEPDLSSADAKFFLLSCTSFVNYLKSQL
ncbi:MAG: AbiJ-NTD4 domain-containing protein, partial [Planctomycetota bacterium]